MKSFTLEERKDFYSEKYFTDGVYIRPSGVPAYCEDLENNKQKARMVVDITRGNSVLDCGCATGWLVHGLRLLEPPVDAYGVDISSFVVGHVISEIEDRVKLCDISEHIPFGDKSFDTVICFDILEHQHDYSRLVSTVQEVCRIARVNILVRQPMTDYNLEYTSDDPVEQQHQQYNWLQTLNVLPHKVRLQLIGIHPYLRKAIPGAESIEHPLVHPREFWIELFGSYGFMEQELEEKYYIFPNTLGLCSFNVLFFRRITNVDGYTPASS